MSAKVILATQADWDVWFYLVRSRAKVTKIWELVDPVFSVRPVSLEEPVEPKSDPEWRLEGDHNRYALYKFKMKLYKFTLEKYERQEKALGDLTLFIQETIAVHNIPFIQMEEVHPWYLLRELKKHLAPSHEARTFQIEQKYHRLCRGPGAQGLESWLDEWAITYTEAKQHDIVEVRDGDERPIRDFLMAIRSEAPTFANGHLAPKSLKTKDDMYDLIQDLREQVCFIRLGSSEGE